MHAQACKAGGESERTDSWAVNPVNSTRTHACAQALSRALAGNYVNFGVFELYGDRALVDALDVALRLALAVPLADIMAYK